MANKKQFFDVKELIKKVPEALYYIIFGERSNGKSYSLLSYSVEKFYKSGFTESFGYIRRWSEDIRLSNLNQVFKGLKNNAFHKNDIEKLTNNEYNDVIVDTRRFFLVHRDDEGNIDKQVDEPLGYIFALSESERIKSTGYPSIKTIILEEFISENLPMINEFTRFKSIISTIVRLDDTTKIFLLGNTVNKHNLYFKEFRLTNAAKQKQNTIELYKFTDIDGRILTIVSNYCDFPDRSLKKSNIYFAFDKDNSQMIRTGAWDIGSYPHLTHRYTDKNIKLIYFIKYENEIYMCEIIKLKDTLDTRLKISPDDYNVSNKNICFTYIHAKTTEIKDPYKHIIYQSEYNPHKNIKYNIMKPNDDISKFIYSFFVNRNVQYQSNDIGDAINAYLNHCRTM